MRCIILAAGYATRLYPLTEFFPKPLLEVGNKTIIDRLVDDISDITDEFIVVTNHRFYNMFRFWAWNKDLNIKVIDDGTENNESRLGAVKDIELVLQKNRIEENCLVMAGDNVLDFSLKEFVKYAEQTGTSCVMCHEESRLKALQKTAVISFDENHIITDYEEKPVNPKGNYAVPPFYYYRPDDLAMIPEALKAGCGYDAPGSFAAWLSKRVPIHAYVMPGKRYDVGDMESYKEVKTLFV